MLCAEIRHRLRTVELDVELSVDPGECLVLAGASGAGKTSILRIIAGLLRPDRARVACGGETWTDTAARRVLPPEARGCGLLFQDYALFAQMPAWRNVAYGLRGVRHARRRAEATAWLERFGVAHLAGERPGRLSGGERQRVALARALAAGPRALLLDEPLAALDPSTRGAAVRELATVLREAGVPAVVVTHDFAEAATLGTRVAVLEAGRIVQCAPPAELAARPATAFVADLTGASVLRGNAAPRGDGLTVVTLDGGARIVTTDVASGRVDVVVRPWEVGLAPPEDPVAAHGSARNHLTGTVVALTPVGNRVRVALAVPEALTADVTAEAVERLGIGVGSAATATFKATATRVMGG